MSINNITSIQPLLDNDKPTVLLFYASWHEPSCAGGEVYTVLQTLEGAINSGDDNDNKLQFACVDAEECADISGKYGVEVVPTLCLLDSKCNLIQRIDGCDDNAAITQAVKHLAENSTTSTSGISSVIDTAMEAPPVTKEEKSKSVQDILEDKLKGLINTSDVTLFMKGNPSSPRCGFSRQAVEMLVEENISFGSFDILTDEEVRQGLKAYSDWPTYPQLYVHGELIGGLDIMKEMKEAGDFAEQLGVTPTPTASPIESLDERLSKLIKRQRIMLFMKGLPSQPFCGFSRQLVEILDKYSAKYDAFNILEDEDVRQGLKKYSDWPTYPQLYVEGDLIGGLDIVKEMDESGELNDLLKGNQTD